MADTNKIGKWGMHAITYQLKNGGVSDGVPKYVKWGTGTTVATANDEFLQAPLAYESLMGVVSQQTTNVANDTFQCYDIVTYLAAPILALAEVGLGISGYGASLNFRSTFSAINININDTFAITYKIIFTNT